MKLTTFLRGLLTHLRDVEFNSEAPSGTDQHAPESSIRAKMASEVEVLRWCMAWLEQLEQGERVVVNLRPDTDDQTQFTRFDHARVMRVLARITSDLDELTRRDLKGGAEILEEESDPLKQHQRRLAEPDEKPRGRTAKGPLQRRLRRVLPPYPWEISLMFWSQTAQKRRSEPKLDKFRSVQFDGPQVLKPCL